MRLNKNRFPVAAETHKECSFWYTYRAQKVLMPHFRADESPGVTPIKSDGLLVLPFRG